MKGKGYRSNVAKAVWIVIVHLAAVAAVICAAFFVMIYQTGIRLDDRGKSYIQSEGFRERLNSRGTDILESLSCRRRSARGARHTASPSRRTMRR